MRDPKGWIQTFTGVQFWPLDPRSEDVRIEDIAHALSNICRFGGHSREFYSVAQHSVLVSTYVPAEHRLVALMHDAPEAYLGDMVRPMKHSRAMQGYRDAEDAVWAAVAETFGLPATIPEPVHVADHRLLYTERRDLIYPRDWPDAGWEKTAGAVAEPYGEVIVPWSPKHAESIFLGHFYAATGVSCL